MGSAILDWKNGTRSRLLWIDFEDYARRVFAGSAADWYRNPVRFAGTLSQALKVLRSDVVAVDVLAPLIAAWRSSPGDDDCPEFPAQLIDSLAGKSEPLAFVTEVADALAHSIGGRSDLVLKLSSPGDLLRAFGATDAVASDYSALDDVSTTLVGLMRRLSSRTFAGLQLSCADPAGLSADEQDAYAPIFRTAEYYGWCTCISYAGRTAVALPQCEADIALFPAVAVEQLAAIGNRRCGGGLTPQFWLGRGAPPATEQGLLHGVIPADAYPETVAEKIKSLG